MVVYDSASIAITNSTFKGVALGLADDSDSEAQSALLVQGATDFTFANNEVSRYFHGIAVLESENTSIVGNDIHSMQGDGSRFAQVNDLLIQDNKFHDFFGSYTTHNDYIQFWTSGTTAPSTDITIRDNLIASAEFQSQAIFFRDELGDSGAGEMRFQNVVIEGNVIYNSHYHGITLVSADNVTVNSNTVIPHPDGDLESSIRIANVTGGEVTDNVAQTFDTPENNVNVVFADNIVVQNDSHILGNYVDDLFLNPGHGANVELNDLMVNPTSSLVNPDGSVAGSELLNVPTMPGELTAIAVVDIDDDGTGPVYLFNAGFTANSFGLVPESDALFTWDFGDSESASGQQVTHTYDGPGDYLVLLNVLHQDGSADTTRIDVEIDDPIDLIIDFDDGGLIFVENEYLI